MDKDAYMHCYLQQKSFKLYDTAFSFVHFKQVHATTAQIQMLIFSAGDVNNFFCPLIPKEVALNSSISCKFVFFKLALIFGKKEFESFNKKQFLLKSTCVM